jgi:hypothetical protein
MSAPDHEILEVARLNNVSCPYCGASLDGGSTTEHLVGRRFVPRGSLHREWNLIMRACPRCNGLKGMLEDDISAVSMHPPLVGPPPPDGGQTKEAARKARGTSGVRPDRSIHKMTIGGPVLPGLSASFEIVGPPPPSEDQITLLARMQIFGIFYWLTYDSARRIGKFFPGTFHVVNWAPRSDWGNPLQRAFAQMALGWPTGFVGITAREFFKVTIRPARTADCLAWALEWNQNYRVLGLLGHPAVLEGYAESLPNLQTALIGRLPNGEIRARTEVPLAAEEDTLFVIPEETSSC